MNQHCQMIHGSKAMLTLCEHDCRRNQQYEGHEDGPIIPTKGTVLDTPACQKSERNTESRDCNQGNAYSRGYRPYVSVWGFAGLLLPSLSHLKKLVWTRYCFFDCAAGEDAFLAGCEVRLVGTQAFEITKSTARDGKR
jgi:hypothetical protein